MKLLAILVSSLVLTGGAFAGKFGAPPGFPKVPGNWSHVDINLTIKKQPHTVSLDRGRITQVSTTQVTIRHPDGTVVTVPLTPQTIVVILGRPATAFDLRKREQAETMRIDGGPAVRLRVTAK